jgi:hypothetical protein
MEDWGLPPWQARLKEARHGLSEMAFDGLY